VQDQPDLAELLVSVREFLEKEIVPAISDQRLRFRARVAASILAIAGREIAEDSGCLAEEARRLEDLLQVGEAPAGGSLCERVMQMNNELARRIREGEIQAHAGSALWIHLRRTAREKLRVANPAYLRRIEGSG